MSYSGDGTEIFEEKVLEVVTDVADVKKRPMSDAKKKQLDAAREVKTSRYKLKKAEEAARLKTLEEKLEALAKKAEAKAKAEAKEEAEAKAKAEAPVPLQKEAVLGRHREAPDQGSGWNVYSILIPIVGIASVILTKYLELKAKEPRPPATKDLEAPKKSGAPPSTLDFFS